MYILYTPLLGEDGSDVLLMFAPRASRLLHEMCLFEALFLGILNVECIKTSAFRLLLFSCRDICSRRWAVRLWLLYWLPLRKFERRQHQDTGSSMGKLIQEYLTLPRHEAVFAFPGAYAETYGRVLDRNVVSDRAVEAHDSCVESSGWTRQESCHLATHLPDVSPFLLP